MFIIILYASCISIILFSIYHYIMINNEKNEYPDKTYNITNDLLTPNNIIVFTM